MKCPICGRPLAEVSEDLFRCLVCNAEFTKDLLTTKDGAGDGEEVIPEKRERIMGSGGYGVGNKAKTVGVDNIAYNFTGVDPTTGKDRKEAILYNRDPGAIGRNDFGFVK